jgi:hypothetical protein
VFRDVAAVLVLSGALGAGCGGAADTDESKPSADSGSSASTSTADRSTQEQEAAAVAIRFARAVAARDWEAVCATRSEKDKDEMARYAGSCERGFAVTFEGEPVSLLATVEAGDVRGTRRGSISSGR